MKKRIAVTGKTSSLGHYVFSKFSEEFELLSLGRTDSDVFIDLTRPDLIESLNVQCDTALLIAADFGGQSIGETTRAIQANISGNLLLSDSLIKNGCNHIVFISSTSAEHKIDNPYYGWYSIIKKFSEETLQFLCDSRDVALTILRPSQIYDVERLFERHQPLLYALIDAAKNDVDFNFSGNPYYSRNYVYVDDVVESIRLCIRERHTGTYSVCGPRSYQIADLASVVFESLQSTSSILIMDKTIIATNAANTDYLPSVPGYMSSTLINDVLPLMLRLGGH